MARAEVPISELKDIVEAKDDRAVQQWIIQQVERGAGKKSKTQ
jgi:hypothetical protein